MMKLVRIFAGILVFGALTILAINLVCKLTATAEHDLGQAQSLEVAANTVKAALEKAAAEGDDEARFVIRFELEGPQVLRGVYLGRFTSPEVARAALDAELKKTREIGNADVLVLFKLGDADSYEIVYALGVRGAEQLFSGDEPLAEESGPTT